MNKIYRGLLLAVLFIVTFESCHKRTDRSSVGRVFYVNARGRADGDGSRKNPWNSVEPINAFDFDPGDSIYFEAGIELTGTIKLDSADSGTKDRPLVLTSRGRKVTVNGGNLSGLTLSNTRYITIANMRFVGSGRKNGNTKDGMVISKSRHIRIDSVVAEGFQKSGVLIHSSLHVTVERIHAHNNGAAGITVGGDSTKSDSQDITIRHCLAENNPGDPTNLTNHSGSGILVGLCRHVLIEYCAATNNGWDMPRVGNGPVGIWAYEADSVTIQYCISYRNKTSKGAEDGGGFDLDGGVTNSLIQYCLSYENEGSGFGIFQYPGASLWQNNTVRFNISENDGLVSRAHAGVFIWNGDGNGKGFRDFYFYNNVIYNEKGVAIHFDKASNRERFMYYNNVFVSGNYLTRGSSQNDVFAGNNWWSESRGFAMDGIKTFEEWIRRREKINGELRGSNLDPGFERRLLTDVTDPLKLVGFIKYKIPAGSSLRTSGVDLGGELGIEPGKVDFNRQPLSPGGIGASF